MGPNQSFSRPTGTRPFFHHLLSLVSAALLLLTAHSTRAAELSKARESLLTGHYAQCISLCQEAIADREWEEEWRLLLIQAQMATGQYTQAGLSLSNALERYSWSLPLRLLAREVLPFTGESSRVAEVMQELETLVATRADLRARDVAALVAIGRATLLLGADPRRVLDNLYEPARKLAPDSREVYLAMGDLAMAKRDYALAAKQYGAGLKKNTDDPELLYGLARAFQSGDRKQMLLNASAALEKNTNHAGALLLVADHLIDAEEYEEAGKLLDRVLKVNPWHPEAWAYRAVLAHLKNDEEGEKSARAKGLRHWKTNPTVDYLIGLNLSQKYRFKEGAAYQRQALTLDPEYVPAKAQLAQDLLRLGQEAEGWQLADTAHQADEYDVTSYNLITLRAKLARFGLVTNEHFTVRMATNEVPIYGEAVLSLLSQARSNLTARYGAVLEQTTMVEIFPEQKDFGVRTFGMPDNPGYLGVCFGTVVTMNSPASQIGRTANWQAVLWHEFTHVITLQMTRNKMPRWLSEGISVFEELQHNPSWGQRMTPEYREMILGEEFVPIGELSSAFLAPKTPLHLQFAYYESALAVEFLVKQFGFESLQKILRDLGEGREINPSIAAHTEPMEKLEENFKKFATERAEALAPKLAFEKPEPRELRSKDWQAANPTNYWALQRQAVDALGRGQWSNALPSLLKLAEAYPGQTGPESALALLARTYRGLNDTNAEREVLEKYTAQDGEAFDAYDRLADLASSTGDWASVRTNALRALAVNPLVPRPHRALARAAEKLGLDNEAIQANRILILLDPPDPAETHYRLARLLHKQGRPEAKRQILQALEEAPRYRDALRLLRELQKGRPVAEAKP